VSVSTAARDGLSHDYSTVARVSYIRNPNKTFGVGVCMGR